MEKWQFLLVTAALVIGGVSVTQEVQDLKAEYLVQIAELHDALDACRAESLESDAREATVFEDNEALEHALDTCTNDLRRCDAWYAQREYAADRNF